MLTFGKGADNNCMGRRFEYPGGLTMLPVLSAGSTLFLVDAWVQMERRGTDWCRRKKIGPIREALKCPPPVTPSAVLTREGPKSPANLYAETEQLLALHCRACGGCEWAGAAIMQSRP